MGKGYARAGGRGGRGRPQRGDHLAASDSRARRAVWGSTDNPQQHFIGWADEVDAERLFVGAAWGVKVVSREPVRPAERSGQAVSAALADGPDPRRAGDAQGDRLHRRRSGAADRRRRHDVDRDHAVQLQPTRAGAAGQGRHPHRRRHADGVQHGVRVRWCLDGAPGMRALAGQPRGDRRLDRAGRPRAPVRRAGLLVGCDKTIPAAAMALAASTCRAGALQRDVAGHVRAATSRSRTC